MALYYQLQIETLDPPVRGCSAKGSFSAFDEAEAWLGFEAYDVIYSAQERLLEILVSRFLSGEPMPAAEPVVAGMLSVAAPLVWVTY